MIKRILPLLLAAILVVPVVPRVYAAEPSVSAEAAVLIDGLTRGVLYEKNKDERLPMASTTKIMTALIALESPHVDDIVTVTEEMVMVEGTSMGLSVGDKVSIYDLCCGMLLLSGNDAANAVALTLGGSFDGFAELMNARAAEIGMSGTHFVTPSGLDDEEHYTTAYDMALLGAAAMDNDALKEITSSSSMQVSLGDPPAPRTIYGHNRLIKSYDGAVGIKTGFTKKSGRCLVSAAERDGVRLIAVTLDAPDDWNDHAAMLDYGFSMAHDVDITADLTGIKQAVVGGRSDSVPVSVENTALRLACGGADSVDSRIYMDRFVYAPLNAGDEVGRVDYFLNGRLICSVPITAAEGADYLEPAG